MSSIAKNVGVAALPDAAAFSKGLAARNNIGKAWLTLFVASLVIALVALVLLFANILNSAYGYVASTFNVPPEQFAPDGDLDRLTNSEMAAVLAQYQPGRVRVFLRDYVSVVPTDQFTRATVAEAFEGLIYPANLGSMPERDLSLEDRTFILGANARRESLEVLIRDTVMVEKFQRTWGLFDSLLNEQAIREEGARRYPDARVYFRVWLTQDFLTLPGSSEPSAAGVRIAIIGTIFVLIVTVLFSFPLGLGAAIYLEEYATKTWYNTFIETNIRNLAGVPSIIYGLLGLAVFVRSLEAFTAGRTIISAGLTLGLLILPVIIINSQEAIRAVPQSVREASYGLGATKWQTIWRNVLPAAIPGILTGTILAMSRAIGETAPLIIIGAATFIQRDPTNLTDRFTVLPIQIYTWSSRAQGEFRSLAAAAIIVLLVILLAFNATAIILRQQLRKRLQS